MRDLVAAIVFHVGVHCLRAGFDVGLTLTIEFHDRLTLFVYACTRVVPRTNVMNGVNGESVLKSERLLPRSQSNGAETDFCLEMCGNGMELERIGCNVCKREIG